MKSLACPYESSVSRAVRSGHWSEALREHAAACRACRETAAVAGWLQAADRAGRSGVSALDPELIWLQSRSIERDTAVDKTLLPVRLVEAIGGLAAFALLVAGLMVQGPEAVRALSGAITSGQDGAAALLAGTWSPSLHIAPLASPAFIAFLAIFAVLAATYPLLSED